MREDVGAMGGAGAELHHRKEGVTHAWDPAVKGGHSAVFLLLIFVNGSPREMGIWPNERNPGHLLQLLMNLCA